MRFRVKLAPGAAICLFLAGWVPAHGQDQPPPRPAAEDALQAPAGQEIQARGPVHEAFAEPTETRPTATPMVAQEPPAPVEETPPDQRPAGDDVVWIPGYWSYNDDAKDFIWVSGLWRTPPPGRQWIPGAWHEVDGGWHWAAGFWGGNDLTELQYLPAPPPSPDDTPAAAPDDDSDFIPGCWIYREGRFWWRPGFWLHHQPDWVWCPARYLWTTGGCVFVDGYWDRPLTERGLLFAPVRFERALLARADFRYQPQFVVQPDFLLGALFVRPSDCHYYFGDYFEPRWAKAGFTPWLDYRLDKRGYDPNFAYYRQEFRKEPGWERGLRELYVGRRDGTIARPPLTLGQQNTVLRTFVRDKTGEVVVSTGINLSNARSVSALTTLARVENLHVNNLASLAVADGRVRNAESHTVLKNVNEHTVNTSIRLAPVTAAERVREVKVATQVRAVAQQRRVEATRLLSEGTAPVKHTDPARTVKIAVPRPVVVERRPEVKPEPERRPEVKPAPVVERRPEVRAPAPPPPKVPVHEERPIPPHEAPHPPAPPKPHPPAKK